ncbi:hypothetical protein [Sandaracinus amylolyticus]|uniref:hypothetical protein n=1 Tax=Sandaracinus amylolyticus TaxID=927083 RepID=UPI001F1BC3DC|nr:hypothetical protein [Sandaracinus amylolyticus]
MNIRELGRFELAAMIALSEGQGSWFIVGSDKPAEEARLLVAELASLVGGVEEVDLATPDTLATVSAQNGQQVIVVSSPWGTELELDRERSRLFRHQPAVLVIPSHELNSLPNVAPHFVSWIGGELHRVAEDQYLSSEARDLRLSALRQQYGMSDIELVKRVEASDVPGDPEVAEWLLLIGRADLLRRSG